MQRHNQVGIEVRIVRVLLQEDKNRALMTVFSGDVGGLLIERVCNTLNRG